MAIKVKHGFSPAAALAEYEKGKAKRAVETARFTKRPIRRSGGGSTGRVAPATPDREIPEKTTPAIQAPNLIGMRQPEVQTIGVGEKAFPTGEFNRQNEAVNASKWERYRSQMMQSGAGDPGPMPGSGYAPKVSGVSSAPSERPSYTPKQRQEHNALADAYQQAVESKLFTEEELPEVKRKIIEEQLGIKMDKVDRLEEDAPPTIQEQIESDTWVDPVTGARLGRDEKGVVKKIADAPKAEVEEEGMDDKAIDSLLGDARRTLVAEGNPLPTEAQVLAKSEQIHKGREALKSRLSGEAVADTETDTESAVAEIEEKVGPAPSSGVSEFFKSLVEETTKVATPFLAVPRAAKAVTDAFRGDKKKPQSEKSLEEQLDEAWGD